MIRPCPKCGKKMLVTAHWNRMDGIIGRRIECPRCEHVLRSYEAMLSKDGRLRSMTITNDGQLELIWT